MLWLIYAIIASIVWGLDYSLGERIFQSKVSPISLLAVQMLIGSLAFLAIGLKSQLLADLQTVWQDKTLLWVFAICIISFNLGNLLIFLSIQQKNATLAGLIELSYPIFTVFFTWALFRINHLNLGTILGALVIFSGVIITSIFSK